MTIVSISDSVSFVHGPWNHNQPFLIAKSYGEALSPQSGHFWLILRWTYYICIINASARAQYKNL